MENALNFSGKVVIVTGGGKGVGKGITESFLAAGADVLICGRSEPESLPQSMGREALFTRCDVRDYEQIEACVSFAVQQYPLFSSGTTMSPRSSSRERPATRMGSITSLATVP